MSYASSENENDDLDVEQLITLVHRRPPIWDKFHSKYSDRIVKSRLWEEIYEGLYFTWELFSASEKKQKEAEVQKKWKNLRDSYFKATTATKKVVSGQGRNKGKRPYIHMGALSFLSNQRSLRDTTNNIRDTESHELGHHITHDLSHDKDTTSKDSRNKRLKASIRKKANNKNNSDDDDILDQLLQQKKYDEDVSFCEMLIPMLKNLSTDQKHYAKIEILNTLNRATKYSQQDVMPPRDSPDLLQYRSSPSHSCYNPKTPPPYPNTPSPYPNNVRQSLSPDLPSQTTPSRNQCAILHSLPASSSSTRYTPSHNKSAILHSPPALSSSTRYTPSHNQSAILHSPPASSSQTRYTPSHNHSFIFHSPPASSSSTRYTPSHNQSAILHSPSASSSSTRYRPSHNQSAILHSPPASSSSTRYTPSHNQSAIHHSPPASSSQAQHTPSHNQYAILHSPPASSSSTRYTPSHNQYAILHSPPASSSQTQHTPSGNQSLSSNFRNTSFDMDDYILFK